MFRKIYIPVFFFVLIIAACNSNKKEQTTPIVSNVSTEDTAANYFPVTNFLLGDINNIKTEAPTPIKKTTINGKTDSSFVKMDSLNIAFQEFLEPRIDSANLKKYFSEKSFKDETLATFTFTYDHRANIVYDFPFINWDVMIDQETNKVKRIYLVKKIDLNTTKQLTWRTGKWCKIVTISNYKVVKEEKITWDFDEQ